MLKRSTLLLLLLGIIWGSNFLFMKMAVALVPALDVAMWRIAFGALPIVVLALLRRQLALTDLRHWVHFLAMACLANLGPYIMFIVGTAHLPSGVAGAIAGAVPCITALVVAVAIPAERPTFRMAVGLLFGLAGILALSPMDVEAGATVEWTGVFAMLAGALSYAVALVYARRFVQPLGLSSLKLAAYQMLFALVLLLPFSHPSSLAALATDSRALVGLILGLGLLGTGIAFVIYYELISEIGALRAGSVYYIPPAVALVLGSAFLGEHLGMREVVGAILVVIGVYYASNKREPARQ